MARCRALLVCSMFCFSSFVSPILAQPTPTTTEPHLPGAITSPPKWLTNVPFDIEEFFRLPDPSENSAPLYLDAFYEIDSTVENCFPPSARLRSTKAKRLAERIFKAYGEWAKDTTSTKLDREEIDSILAAARTGLTKLDKAQRRPRCVFAAGITLESPIPHAQASRTAACLWTIRALRSVDRGDLDSAIEDIRRILRLSRDLKARGSFITQIVSAAFDRIACIDVVPIILAHPRLKPLQSQRLLAILNEHERLRLDSLIVGPKAEYVMIRSLIRVFEDGKLITVDNSGISVEKSIDQPEMLRYMAALIAQKRTEPGITADLVLKDEGFVKTFSEYLKLVNTYVALDHKAADDLITTVLAFDQQPFARKIEIYDNLFERFRTAKADPKTTPYLFLYLLSKPDFIAQFTAIPVFTHMAQALVALKRWELLNKKPPNSLETACRDAGLPSVPVDNFANKPIRLIQLSGRPAIYSYGIDGDDDRGQQDSAFGRKPDGDFLFILPRFRSR